MLINNFEKLNDNFIDFNLTRIKKYFDDNAWKNLLDLHDSKILHSKCSICDNFFLEMRFERTLGWGANFIKFMGLC